MMGARCAVVYRSMFGTFPCGSIEVVKHLRAGSGEDPVADFVLVCDVCWGRVKRAGGFANGPYFADHDVDLPCLVPEGAWRDEGCTLPIPDTASEVTDLVQGVPA